MNTKQKIGVALCIIAALWFASLILTTPTLFTALLMYIAYKAGWRLLQGKPIIELEFTDGEKVII